MLALLSAPARAQESPDVLASALAFAAGNGNAAEVKALLDKGAKPDGALNSLGVPALALAASRSDTEAEAVLKTLLDAKANVNIPDKTGQTPLFYAAKADLPKNITLLLERGASLEQLDSTNNNARTFAYAQGRKNIVELMDNFTKAQNDAVLKQYEARNKEIEERNALLAKRNEEIAAQNEQIKAMFEEKAAKEKAQKEALEAQRKEAEMRAEQKKIAQIEAKAAPKELDTATLQKLIRDVSYHSCAVEYWKFCRSNRVQADISREEMSIQIEAHDTLAAEAVQRMKKEFRAKNAYINRVIDPSVKQIRRELGVHATNANLKAEGAGTKAHMDERCSIIADQWEFASNRPGAKPRRQSATAKPAP